MEFERACRHVVGRIAGADGGDVGPRRKRAQVDHKALFARVEQAVHRSDGNIGSAVQRELERLDRTERVLGDSGELLALHAQVDDLRPVIVHQERER